MWRYAPSYYENQNIESTQIDLQTWFPCKVTKRPKRTTKTNREYL